MHINQWLGCICVQKLREAAALGARVAVEEELGIDLVDVLLDASFGEEELLGDLAVAQTRSGQLGDLASRSL